MATVPKKQFLTKSRFKIGYECPTKLYYQDNKEYGNNNVENAFLAALAEGGFQVGELAKIYFPGGTEITTNNKDEAAAQTAELLKKDKVVIYEVSFKFENLFVKTDVVVKNGDFVELIEVKAKSYDPNEDDSFYNKTKLKKNVYEINSKWEPYLIDVAFQTYVFKKAFPQYKVNSCLMMANKTVTASVDGLNQMFFLAKDKDERVKALTSPNANIETVGNPILIKVPVDDEIKVLWNSKFEIGRSFEEMVQLLSDVCENQKFVKPDVGGKCKSCEFRIAKDLKDKGYKSGFENCWEKVHNLKDADFKKPSVFEIWNYRKADKLIEQKKFFIDDVDLEDISPTPHADEPGLSSTERQWLQIEKIKNKDGKPYFNYEGLASEMKSWTYPLHFIDFETTMVAIPFNKGRRPYEQMAFQFSHHILEKDGSIRHHDEYIHRKKGHFPNFDFLRALKKSLSGDEGTIFRFATHENTVLCQIREQLLKSEEVIADKDELIAFIESITQAGEKSDVKWTGKRNMVDMCDLVKKYFYHPDTKGSNSIKKVLPAILNDSEFLQQLYSKPVYGTDKIKSKNFANWIWIEKDKAGKVIDPYKRLPEIFTDLDLDTMDSLISEGSIADGGAAMTAYSRMQFTEMTEFEFDKVAEALLKYCELDTFAMVMIYEYWKHEVAKVVKLAA